MIHVVVGVITNPQGFIYVTKRSLDKPHGGYWEFPGGKIEPHESPLDALVRELKEEIGIEVIKAHYLGQIKHHYPQKEVCLHVYRVTRYTGRFLNLDGQLDARWVSLEEVQKLSFPQANQKIIDDYLLYMSEKPNLQTSDL